MRCDTLILAAVLALGVAVGDAAGAPSVCASEYQEVMETAKGFDSDYQSRIRALLDSQPRAILRPFGDGCSRPSQVVETYQKELEATKSTFKTVKQGPITAEEKALLHQRQIAVARWRSTARSWRVARP